MQVRKFRADLESIIASLGLLGFTIEGNKTAETMIICLTLYRIPKLMRENMRRAAGDKILELENFRRVLRTELELLCSASNVSQCSSKIEPSKSNPILEQSTTGVFSLSVL